MPADCTYMPFSLCGLPVDLALDSGENPKWQSTEPYYDSYYCNWDTFRTLYPLFSLHDPERFALITRAMIDIWRFEGEP